MRVIESALEKEGFYPDQVIPDGKIHRFKRDKDDKGKSAWVIAYQNNSTNGGEQFFVAVFGDWHEPENIYKFCSLTTQSTADKKNIEDLIRKAERNRQKELDALWLETSLKATEAWKTMAETGTTPYLERKMIGLGGARIRDGVVCVPARDLEGRIWGLQKIFPDGKKLFMPGTKKRGNFHVLRGPKPITEAETIYVCEGFSTGASVNIATNETVVVAFDSGNLLPVCQLLRQTLPEARIIICGDDDRFQKRPDGTPWNPGRESGDKAAAAILGKAVFPSFARPDDKALTDFNDLHVAEGIEAVRNQLSTDSVAAERHYVLALGHKGNTYFYSSNSNQQILPLVSHSSDNLTSLQPVEYWEALHASKAGVDWTAAASSLKTRCRAKGIFNPQNVRGLGVWLDEGRVVVHLGNRLLVDGKLTGLHDVKTRHIYTLEETQPSIAGQPLKDCSTLLTTISNMAWARDQDATFFAGWLVTAMLSGVLQWRPHMWLIGGTGAGKSVTYEIIAKVMGGHVTTLAGGTSEAGLRRSVRGSALPLIFDEFELNDNATMLENQKILAFMRQASSDSSAQIVKADQASGVVTYQPRFCAFVAGIRPSFNNEADRNRFTLIELDRAKQNSEQWAKVEAAKALIDRDYATGLFLRALHLLPVYRKSMAVYADILSRAHYARFAQQFAPILAGYHSLLSEEPATTEDAGAIVAGLQLEHEIAEIRDQNDEQEAINLVLHTKVRCGTEGDRAIVELLLAANNRVNGYAGIDADAAAHHLQRFGLSWLPGQKMLFIAAKHPELSRIFEKTRFPINWKYSLARIPGTEKNKVVRILGKNVKGVGVPVELSNT